MARADHLYVYRHYGFITHHGIDCGDGTVIHYKEGESIVRTTRDFFARGDEILVRVYDRCDPPDVVLKRAFSRLGERDYSVIFNNCEHFATWCKTGQSSSDQINNALSVSFAGGVLGGTLLGGAFAAPAIAALGLYGVHQLTSRAAAARDPQASRALLQEALEQLRTTHQQIEPAYQAAVREAAQWHQIAETALRQGKEEVARAALLRKRTCRLQAEEKREQLNQLRAIAVSLEGSVKALSS